MREVSSSVAYHEQPRIPLSVNDLVERALSSKAPDLSFRGITLEARLAQDLPPAIGDPDRLYHILVGLLTHIQHGATKPVQHEPLYVYTRTIRFVSLTDQGSAHPSSGTRYVEIGVPAPRHKSVNASHRDASPEGTECALTQVRQAIEELGGQLKVDTTANDGPWFRIRTPVFEPQRPRHTGEAPSSPDAHGEAPLPEQQALFEETHGLASQERRRAPRINLPLEATVSVDGEIWKGIALNISFSGVYVIVEGTVPVAENQPVQLCFVGEGTVFEMTGKVRGTREAFIHYFGTPDIPPLGLPIEYETLAPKDRVILEALLEAVRDQHIVMSLKVILSPQETGDLLLEVSSLGDTSLPHAAIHPGLSEEEEPAALERRLRARVDLAMPARVEIQGPSLGGQSLAASTINLSLGGACIRLNTEHELKGYRLLLHLSPPYPNADLLPNAEGTNADHTVAAQIVWTDLDVDSKSEIVTIPRAKARRAGLRFLHVNEECEHCIERLVSLVLNSPIRVPENGEKARLISELIECRNEMDQRIAVYHDRPRQTLAPNSPVVIISPGYGETKKEFVALGYYLAANGFHTLRYDHTNHVGESQGDILHTTLTGMNQDLHALIDKAKRDWPASPIMVIANSLAGRIALKAASQDQSIKFLLLLNAVVDLQATLLAVHNEDLIGTYQAGTRRGVVNVLGFNVDLDRFLEDAVAERYAELATTLCDAQAVRTPVVSFCSERDAWVDLASVRQVQVALGPLAKHFYVIPEALHRLHENPRKARAVFRQLVRCCLEAASSQSAPEEIVDPPEREIRLQSRLERERTRAQHHFARSQNIEFWRDYLDHFHYIVNFSDYWSLLDHIYRLLSNANRPLRILDAGCGNGNFGMFLLINRVYRQGNSPAIRQQPSHYVGVDFIASALTQTQMNLTRVTAELRMKFPPSLVDQVPVRNSIGLADLNLPLPFKDNEFDGIVCNLVLGYLQDPLFTLRELVRVLTPRGRLVVTNLKPKADLSQIYRNFISTTNRPEEVEAAQHLLSNSGKIKQGESDGLFRFFNKPELTMLLSLGGAVKVRIYSTFASQAYIAIAEKPDFTG